MGSHLNMNIIRSERLSSGTVDITISVEQNRIKIVVFMGISLDKVI